MSKLIYVAFDQLNKNYGALKGAKPQEDVVVLVESQRMVIGRKWHKQRLHFLISSARHFANELEQVGFKVLYLKSATTKAGISEAQKKYPKHELVCAAPNSFKLRGDLIALGANVQESDFFLTSEPLFKLWADAQKTFTMENFYRAQRRRLNILMNGDKPVGGNWNYDAENRLPPPKDHDWGKTLTFKADEIDDQVKSELPKAAWGEFKHKIWGTSRAEALKQMKHFFDHHFSQFGPYEDAMPNSSWSAHHSLLSPYLNNGLLHPSEVIKAALKKFEAGEVSIESAEGFIRQIIGWREFIKIVYEREGTKQRTKNYWNFNRKIPKCFWDGTTGIAPIDITIKKILKTGYCHHIERLMVLGNFMLLCEFDPDEVYKWFMEMFIDAYDWVMVPNVYGMTQFSDGGLMTTKPYISGSNYLMKMSDYEKGEWQQVWDGLFWRFMHVHRSFFLSNPRIGMLVHTYDKMSKEKQNMHLSFANDFLNKLDKAT